MAKRILIAIGVVTLLIAVAMFLTHKKPLRTIAIVSGSEFPVITQLEDGFKQRIEKSPLGDSIAFTYDNAQNDAGLRNQIVDKLIKNRPDLIYVLGTPIATAIQKRDSALIIVQGAVTDPIEAGLAKSWDGSGKNYAATTDLPPVQKQIALIMQLIPGIKALGLIYNTSEANSVAVVKRIRKYVDDNKLAIKLEERPVANTSDVSTATESVNGKVEAIYIPPDNTVHAAMQVVCKIARDYKIPVFTTVQSSLAHGAFAALSLDYTKLGEQSADIAILILQGRQWPGAIPIKPIDNPRIIINGTVAAALNIDLSSVKSQTNIEINNP